MQLYQWYQTIFFLLGLLLMMLVVIIIHARHILSRPSRVYLRTLDEIDAEQRSVVDDPADVLSKLGFEFWGYCAGKPASAFDPRDELLSAIWLTPDRMALAHVTQVEPDFDVAFSVNFLSRLSNGEVAVTTARRFAPPREALGRHLRVVNIFAGRLADQLAAHRHQCEIDGPEATPQPIADPVRVVNAVTRETANAAIASKREILQKDGYCRLTWKGAFLAVFRLFRYSRKRGQIAPYSSLALNQRIAMSWPWLEYGERLAVGIKWSNHFRIGMFAVTGLLTFAALWFGKAWTLAPALMLVILIHEFGHALAMKWLGYSNVQIFFIPFFGGAASGQTRHVKVWQEMVVLLAGPLPGLLLGIVLQIALPSDRTSPLVNLLGQISLLAMLINGFNLLPVVPMDGGKIVEMLLARRWPGMLLWSLLFSAVGMFVLGLGLGAPLLCVIGVFSLRRYPAVKKQVAMLRSLVSRADFGTDTNATSRLRSIVGLIANTTLRPEPFTRRINLVRALTRVSAQPRLSLAGSLGGLFAYGIVTFVVFALCIWSTYFSRIDTTAAPHALDENQPATQANIAKAVTNVRTDAFNELTQTFTSARAELDGSKRYQLMLQAVQSWSAACACGRELEQAAVNNDDTTISDIPKAALVASALPLTEQQLQTLHVSITELRAAAQQSADPISATAKVDLLACRFEDAACAEVATQVILHYDGAAIPPRYYDPLAKALLLRARQARLDDNDRIALLTRVTLLPFVQDPSGNGDEDDDDQDPDYGMSALTGLGTIAWRTQAFEALDQAFARVRSAASDSVRRDSLRWAEIDYRLDRHQLDSATALLKEVGPYESAEFLRDEQLLLAFERANWTAAAKWRSQVHDAHESNVNRLPWWVRVLSFILRRGAPMRHQSVTDSLYDIRIALETGDSASVKKLIDGLDIDGPDSVSVKSQLHHLCKPLQPEFYYFGAVVHQRALLPACQRLGLHY